MTFSFSTESTVRSTSKLELVAMETDALDYTTSQLSVRR